MSASLYFQVESSAMGDTGEPRWSHFARLFGLDDPLLIAFLTGQRADELPDGVFPLTVRGLPPDVCEATLEEGCLAIDDEAAGLEIADTCSQDEAEKAVELGHSILLHGGHAITHPDFHSWSWASLEELLPVLGCYQDLAGVGVAEFRAVLALMESLRDSGLGSRAVFWLSC